MIRVFLILLLTGQALAEPKSDLRDETKPPEFATLDLRGGLAEPNFVLIVDATPPDKFRRITLEALEVEKRLKLPLSAILLLNAPLPRESAGQRLPPHNADSLRTFIINADDQALERYLNADFKKHTGKLSEFELKYLYKNPERLLTREHKERLELLKKIDLESAFAERQRQKFARYRLPYIPEGFEIAAEVDGAKLLQSDNVSEGPVYIVNSNKKKQFVTNPIDAVPAVQALLIGRASESRSGTKLSVRGPSLLLMPIAAPQRLANQVPTLPECQTEETRRIQIFNRPLFAEQKDFVFVDGVESSDPQIINYPSGAELTPELQAKNPMLMLGLMLPLRCLPTRFSVETVGSERYFVFKELVDSEPAE